MAEIKQKLAPFRVPNFVLLEMPPRPRGDGFNMDTPKLPLHEVPEDVLLQLCEEFKQAVLEKHRAGPSAENPYRLDAPGNLVSD